MQDHGQVLEGLVPVGSVKVACEHARLLVHQQVQRKKGADIAQTPQVTPSRVDWDMSLAARG